MSMKDAPLREWTDADDVRAEEQDWIVCVSDNHADRTGRAWCGRPTLFGFMFTSVDHAAMNGRNEGRLIVCPECLAEILKGLNNGQDEQT